VWQLCFASYWTLFFVRVVVDLDLSPLELVLLGTAKEITVLSAEIPTGVVADMRSRRLSVIIGFLVCGLAVIAAGLAGGFILVAFTQVLWAFGTTFRSGAETAWFTDEVRSVDLVDVVLPRRAKFASAGSIIGIVVAAAFASVVGLSIALVAVGGLLIGWGITLSRRMPETGFSRPDTSVRTGFGALLGQGISASRRPSLRILLIVTVLTGFASEAVDRLDIARLDQIGLPETIDVVLLIGAVAVIQSIGAIFILFVFANRLAGRRLVHVSVALHAVTALGVALLARFDPLVVALIGLIAAGTVREVATTVTVGWTNHFTDKSNRATVHSFVGQAKSFGEISGGLVLGVIAQTIGITWALTVSAVIYFVAAGVASLGRSRWSLPAKPARRTGTSSS
jgi:DHA3 family tetracycline resistance protein-like MFS transporter